MVLKQLYVFLFLTQYIDKCTRDKQQKKCVLIEIQYYNQGWSMIGDFYLDRRFFDRKVFAAIRTHEFRFIPSKCPKKKNTCMI